MAVYDQDWQALLLQQVGDAPDNRVETALPLLWNAYADKRFVAPRLQYQYALRAALDLLLGYYRTQVNAAVGPLRRDMGAQVDHLLSMRQQAQAELVLIESRARANRAPATGLILAVEPIAPPAGALDANAQRYRGDIYAGLDDLEDDSGVSDDVPGTPGSDDD